MSRGEKWDRRFLELTREIAKWSKDPSTQLGCVVVGPDLEIRSTGFNGFPRGVEDHPSRYADRDLKLAIICHSEENAIMNAARIGVSLQGCDLYCGWLPCTRCARGIIQVGIKRVVIPVAEVPERWRADFELSEKILTEAGVQIVTVEP